MKQKYLNYIIVALYVADGRFANVYPAQIKGLDDAGKPVYELPPNSVLSVPSGIAPAGKDWRINESRDGWVLADDYADVVVYDIRTAQRIAPPDFGQPMAEYMTLIEPQFKSGMVTYWDGSADEWAMRKDWSGTQVWSTNDPLQSIVLSTSYAGIPDGFTDKQPPSDAYDWDAKKSEWVLNKDKQAELDAQAEQQAVESVKHALQAHIDAVAVGLGFGGGNAVMLYAGFTNAFQSLAQAFGAWEAGIWAQANQYMAQVKAGEAPMLTPEQAVERIPAFEFTGA